MVMLLPKPEFDATLRGDERLLSNALPGALNDGELKSQFYSFPGTFEFYNSLYSRPVN